MDSLLEHIIVESVALIKHSNSNCVNNHPNRDDSVLQKLGELPLEGDKQKLDNQQDPARVNEDL